MVSSSILRRAYDTVALVALVNMVAMGAVVCWLAGSGSVNKERINRIAAVLRGDEQPVKEATTEGQGGPGPDAKKRPSEPPSVAQAQMDMETVRREADRVKEELRQRLALNNSILLRVTTERESFKSERESAKRQEKATRENRETEGFAKQVAIYDSLKPATALQHLLGLGDADEAAEILLAMKTRQAKKVIEAAQRGNQRQQMMTILQRIREVSPGKSAELLDR
jgi:hypothetical protein